MNFSSIDLDKIEFSKLCQDNTNRYYLISYENDDNLLLKIDNLFISNIEEVDNNTLIKFKISNNLYNNIKKLEEKIIEFLYQNKNNVYQTNNSINNALIKNLFFSNIEVIDNQHFLNISLEKKNSIFGHNKYVDILIKINGIWIYEEMFGISYIIV